MVYLKIIRPLNVFIAILTIWVAALVTGQFYISQNLILASIIAGLITCAANVINDVYDIGIDRINKPNRLLPSGRISVQQAIIYFILLDLSAFILAAYTNLAMFLIALVIGVLLIFYSSYFKRTVLLGNLIVSLSTAMAFIFGALSVNNWKAGLIPAVFAFFFHFGREVIKDMQDCEGDLAENAITFPGKHGVKKSIFLVNLIFIVLVFLTFLPYILHIYDGWYLLTVVIGVDLVLTAVCTVLWFRYDSAFLGKVSHLLKLDMLIGLLAIYVGV